MKQFITCWMIYNIVVISINHDDYYYDRTKRDYNIGVSAAHLVLNNHHHHSQHQQHFDDDDDDDTIHTTTTTTVEQHDDDPINPSSTMMMMTQQHNHHRQTSVSASGSKFIVDSGSNICGTISSPTKEQMIESKRIVEAYVMKQLLLRGNITTGSDSDYYTTMSKQTVTIPTYFHVISAGIIGTVTDNELYGQLDVLNDIYIQYGFTIQLLNITRTDNSAWYYAEVRSLEEYDMKSSLRIGDASTLNIYFNNAGDDYLGYATLPMNYQDEPLYDGVVINSITIPNGTIIPEYNGGIILVHEIGHWLGLYHTFQPDYRFFYYIQILLYVFNLRNPCSGIGDGVDDTPQQNGPTRGCPIGKDTCRFRDGMDPIHNYMDYSYTTCMEEFTPGQTIRMMAMWEKYRSTN